MRPPTPSSNGVPLTGTRLKKRAGAADAYRKGRSRWKVLLTHSPYGRLWAIRRVVTNKDKTTLGVDRYVWNTPKKKMQDVNRLKRIKEYIRF
jgi:RNA-directed DNA polymerase